MRCAASSGLANHAAGNKEAAGGKIRGRPPAGSRDDRPRSHTPGAQHDSEGLLITVALLSGAGTVHDALQKQRRQLIEQLNGSLVSSPGNLAQVTAYHVRLIADTQEPRLTTGKVRLTQERVRVRSEGPSQGAPRASTGIEEGWGAFAPAAAAPAGPAGDSAKGRARRSAAAIAAQAFARKLLVSDAWAD